MAAPTKNIVKTVPINAGNGWNPSDWYTGNMTPPVPQPNGTLQQANWTDISNNPSTPLVAINAAVPRANGSIIPNKDLSRLAPSPAGLPALYGQPMPPVFGGSWANFADAMGSGWTGGGGYDAQGLPIDANTPLNLSGYETSPGLSGRPVTHSGPVPTTVKIGSGKMVAPGRYTSRSGDPLEVRANGDVVTPRNGYVAKASGSTAGTRKTPGMAAYDAHQAAFYSDVPKSLISGSSRSRSPAEREADLIARWQRKNPGVEMPADILAQIRQNSKGDHRQTVQSGPSPTAQPTGQPRRSEPIPRQRPTPMLPRQPDQTSSSGQGPGEGVRRSTPMLPVLQDIKRRFLGG